MFAFFSTKSAVIVSFFFENPDKRDISAIPFIKRGTPLFSLKIAGFTVVSNSSYFPPST